MLYKVSLSLLTSNLWDNGYVNHKKYRKSILTFHTYDNIEGMLMYSKGEYIQYLLVTEQRAAL
jgi:hypothetical protein